MKDLVPTTKPEAKRSELWLSIITAVGALVGSNLSSEGKSWVGVGVAVLLAVVYAFFRTPMAAEKPGVGTKVFWGSVVTILGSGAAALVDPTLPGVPEGVGRIAAIAVAAVTAAGYTIHRFRAKVKR